LRLISDVGVDDLDVKADVSERFVSCGFCGTAPHAAEIIEKKTASELFLQQMLTIQ
jgi:hypothetical protein